jgi:hypothetical protein
VKYIYVFGAANPSPHFRLFIVSPAQMARYTKLKPAAKQNLRSVLTDSDACTYPILIIGQQYQPIYAKLAAQAASDVPLLCHERRMPIDV